ncbi:MAG: hypothetical protein ACI8TQ_002797 [Planctomycetota bacterium]|jgi:hypothetical protein
MALTALIVAIGGFLSIGWLRRDLKQVEKEMIELHEEILRLKTQAR